jgi:L-lactate dehydrogenase complex protein LldE
MRSMTWMELFASGWGKIGFRWIEWRNTISDRETPAVARDGGGNGEKMKVGLFVTCLVDLMRPRIGFAALRLLEAAGCEVVVPETQTCCGQPAWNAGDRRAARLLAEKLLAEFEGCDYVVAPSGSCAGMIRTHYPDLFADDPAWLARAAALASRTYELADFLATVAKPDKLPGNFTGTVTYHDSCSGLRELGVKAQPRALLAKLPGVMLTEMNGAEECCGFGGTFAVKFGEVSARIAEKKCENVRASGADAVVLGDLGCMLNIEGKLRRMGDEKTRVLHIAEILAGEA